MPEPDRTDVRRVAVLDHTRRSHPLGGRGHAAGVGCGDGLDVRACEPVVVEPQHGHVPDRVGGFVVAPALHLRGGQAEDRMIS